MFGDVRSTTGISMKLTVRLLLVVDREIIRDGMRALLETSPDVLIVGEDVEVATGLDEMVARSWPDVVLVHESLRDRDGLSTAAAIIDRHGDDVGVMVLASAPDPARIDRAVRAGVKGYLLEDDETWLLTAGIRAVATKQAWWSPRATDVLLTEYRKGTMAELRHRDAADLTPRERSVVRLVALGRSNAEIADELVLGRATVKSHISRILAKLELRDRTQLAAYAYRNGLVTTE
jgi:DNA-binding NarL/FixJ family response regulator